MTFEWHEKGKWTERFWIEIVERVQISVFCVCFVSFLMVHRIEHRTLRSYAQENIAVQLKRNDKLDQLISDIKEIMSLKLRLKLLKKIE